LNDILLHFAHGSEEEEDEYEEMGNDFDLVGGNRFLIKYQKDTQKQKIHHSLPPSDKSMIVNNGVNVASTLGKNKDSNVAADTNAMVRTRNLLTANKGTNVGMPINRTVIVAPRVIVVDNFEQARLSVKYSDPGVKMVIKHLNSKRGHLVLQAGNNNSDLRCIGRFDVINHLVTYKDGHIFLTWYPQTTNSNSKMCQCGICDGKTHKANGFCSLYTYRIANGHGGWQYYIGCTLNDRKTQNARGEETNNDGINSNKWQHDGESTQSIDEKKKKKKKEWWQQPSFFLVETDT
jgi:hypothetical protein